MLTDHADYVLEVRREAAARLESRLADLEGKVAAVMSGPIEIPRDGSPMVDAWARIRHELGAYAHNFTIRGDRLFVKSRRGGAIGGLGTAAGAVGVLVDSLDAYLERYDPGSVNINDALEAFCDDLAAIAELRDQRGAIMRDGLADPRSIADSELELAALTGTVDQAAELVGIILADSAPAPVELVDPVGIKEIAERLYVRRRTVDQWLQRGIMPLPRWTVGGRPAWDWSDIAAWSTSTGRETNAAKVAELEAF